MLVQQRLQVHTPTSAASLVLSSRLTHVQSVMCCTTMFFLLYLLHSFGVFFFVQASAASSVQETALQHAAVLTTIIDIPAAAVYQIYRALDGSTRRAVLLSSKQVSRFTYQRSQPTYQRSHTRPLKVGRWAETQKSWTIVLHITATWHESASLATHCRMTGRHGA